MCRIYSIYQWIARRWLSFAIALFLGALVFALVGYSELARIRENAEPVEFRPWQWSTTLYHALKLFALDDAEAEGNVPWPLDIARWMAAALWSFAVATVLMRLFSQPAVEALVGLLARNHVVFCGLGRPQERRERLISDLRARGTNVVLLEPDSNHPGLQACRDAGAVCLARSAQTATELERAFLHRAKALICLGGDDSANVNTLARAHEVLERSAASGVQLDCLMEVGDPGLLDAMRRHPLYAAEGRYIKLGVFNAHEMVARAMLRETMIGRHLPALQKILIVGCGRSGRMGEVLATRAIKDHWLEYPSGPPLEIHIIDRNADEWARYVSEKAAHLQHAFGVMPIPHSAARSGFQPTDQWRGIVEEGYDAIFVCIADESLAAVQAIRIVDVLSAATETGGRRTSVPVIVRVQQEGHGFGRILAQFELDRAEKRLRIVGWRDRVHDVVHSLQPSYELLAQVLHQDYVALLQKRLLHAPATEASQIEDKPAFRPWTALDEKYRESNRQLARRLHRRLEIPQINGAKPRTFRLEFTPDAVINVNASYQLSDEELERLAELEHNDWMDERLKAGWRFGSSADQQNAPRGITYNENMTPWNALNEQAKEHDRTIIRRLPIVLAKADYNLVEVH